MQVPATLQTPDWHSAAVAAVQPACPLSKPHLPLLPQTSFVHWFAAVQPSLLERAQVFFAALHCSDVQTAAAFAAVQVPSCRVSFEIATPAPSFVLHVKLDRSQNCEAVQSPSTQQPPTGMQALPVLQTPDWHSAPVATVQPDCPLS